jgi:cytochrome c
MRTRVSAVGLLAAGVTAAQAQVDAQAAMALAEKNLCLSCHKVDARLVGPAYKDVAARYRDDPGALDRLAAKVAQGGKGVWGKVAMPPNKDVSEADIRTIVTWVLSLH